MGKSWVIEINKGTNYDNLLEYYKEAVDRGVSITTSGSYNYNNKKNNPYVINDDQIFYNKLSDDDLNNLLLNSRSIFNTIEEEKLYKSSGKTVDYSFNNGLESIIFHEGLD